MNRYIHWVRKIPVRVLLMYLFLIAVAGLLAFSVLRAHLAFWRVVDAKSLSSVQRLPCEQMPASYNAATTKPFNFEGTTVFLPASMVPDEDFAGVYRDASMQIVIGVLHVEEQSELLQKANRLSSGHVFDTLPQLYAKAFSVDLGDYSYCSTPSELATLQFMIFTARQVQEVNTGWAERHVNRGVDALLHVHSDQRATLFWDIKEPPRGGYMHFSSQRKELDLDAVRDITRTLR